MLEKWIQEGRDLITGPGVDPGHRKLMEAHIAALEASLGLQGGRVARFTNGALKDLERNHAVVFDPFETSLARLVSARKQFVYIVCQDDNRFMNVTSRPSQVVIFPEPERFYVPESSRHSLADQRSIQAVDSEQVLNKKMGIGGVEWVIGDVATHAGLVFAYLDKTGGKVRLHGQDYGFRYARTETPTVGSSVADVGDFDADDGLIVSSWDAGLGYDNVWAVRLGVPAQE